MKILLVSNMYPSEQFPSYGVFVRNTEQILLENNIHVDKVVMQKKTKKFNKLIAYASHYVKMIWTGLTKNYDYIYVHYASHNALPLLVLKKLKKHVKIVTNVHGSDVVPEVPSQEKFQPRVRQLLHESTKIITPSPYYKQLVKKKYEVERPIYVFPSGGVNFKLFHSFPTKEKAYKELNLDATQRYIGCVSRIDVGKGWEYYLQAIAQLEKETPTTYKYIYVGSGKDEEKFHSMIKELQLESKIVHFPLLPQTSLAYIYNVIDTFIFPTVREGESLGLVGLEAMACGAPVIGSRIGGLKDYIIDGQNGLFFEPGQAPELTRQLRSFIHFPDHTKEQMSQQAVKTAQQYSVDVISEQLPTIFFDEVER
ncbi:glycosyltransferase family 4 protein [Priestia megaterium]|nr:glycosyltransferase family 4 protein [Priestia megaterium]